MNAVEHLTNTHGKLMDYSLRAVSQGKDALGEETVKVDFGRSQIGPAKAPNDRNLLFDTLFDLFAARVKGCAIAPINVQRIFFNIWVCGWRINLGVSQN